MYALAHNLRNRKKTNKPVKPQTAPKYMLARIPLKVAAYANKTHKEVKNQNNSSQFMMRNITVNTHNHVRTKSLGFSKSCRFFKPFPPQPATSLHWIYSLTLGEVWFLSCCLATSWALPMFGCQDSFLSNCLGSSCMTISRASWKLTTVLSWETQWLKRYRNSLIRETMLKSSNSLLETLKRIVQ